MDIYDNCADLSDLLKIIGDMSTEAVFQAMRNLDSIAQAFFEASNSITEESIEAASKMMEKFAALTPDALQAQVEISEEVIDSLQELIPLVPESKQSEIAQLIADGPEAKKKFFTWENVRRLFAWVVPIAVAIALSNTTSGQLERIIEQNDKNIELREMQLELSQRQTESLESIYNFLQEISNDLVLVNGRFYVPDNQTDILDNSVYTSGNSDTPDNQDDDANN